MEQAKRRDSSFTATLTIIIEVLQEMTPCPQTSSSLHFVGMHRRFQGRLVPTKIVEKSFLAVLPTLEDEADNVIQTVEMYEVRRCSSERARRIEIAIKLLL